MINQIVKNIACGSSNKMPDLTSVIDGSFKKRLRNMRLVKASHSKVVVSHDNQLWFGLIKLYNYSRVKHTDRIGVNYWASAKYDPNRTVAPVSYYALLEGDVKPLQHQAAILDGTMELPTHAWSKEIDCLNTFVSSSSRQKIVGQYTRIEQKPTSEFRSFAAPVQFTAPADHAWQAHAEATIEKLFSGQDDSNSLAPVQKAAKSKKSRAKKTVQVDNVMQMVQGQPMPSNVTGITGEQSGRNRRKAITSSQKVLVSI